MRVYIIDRAEQLLLCKVISGRTVTADSDTDEPCAAALSLCLVNRVQDALADSIKVAAGTAKPFKFARQTVLDIFIFTAAAL